MEYRVSKKRLMELANVTKPAINEASVVLDGMPTPEYIANALKVTRKFDLGNISADGIRNLKAWIQSNLNVSPGKLVYRGILDKRIKTPYWIVDTTGLPTDQVVPLLKYVFDYGYNRPNQQSINEIDQQQIIDFTNSIEDTFKGIQDMPVDDKAKLEVAKMGVGVAIINAIGEKLGAGKNVAIKGMATGAGVSPEGRTRLQNMIRNLGQASSVQAVKQALLDALDDLAAQQGGM